MAVALHLDDLVEFFRKTAIPALFARREQKERVDTKVRPFKVEDNFITLALYDFPSNEMISLSYSKVKLPLSHPIVRELREKFAQFYHGTFSGDFTLSELGWINLFGEDLASFESEITIGETKYYARFNGNYNHIYMTEIKRK